MGTRQYILSLFRAFLFFLIIFILSRALFLGYYHDRVFEKGVSEALLAFYHAMALDIAASSMFIAIPAILSSVLLFWSNAVAAKILRAYIWVAALIITLVASLETVLYYEWGTKLHYKVFTHLSDPTEAINTAEAKHYALFLAFIVFHLLLIWVLYKKLIRRNWKIAESVRTNRMEIVKRSIAFLSVLTLLSVLMRGGFQPIPVNQSDCFYSSLRILNDAATNPTWNLLHSTIENKYNFSSGNPYAYMDRSEAETIVKKIYSPIETDVTIPDSLQDTQPSQILTTKKPNVVIIILESWSAELGEVIGQFTGIIPNFDKLAKNGLIFRNIYSTGNTSDQGIPAILSGTHALPIANIIGEPAKAINLPSLGKEFDNLGYTTSFYYAGQLSYGNIKGYVYNSQFKRILEHYDFPDKPSGRLGIHDEYLFERHLEDLENEAQPFFSVVYTLSTHPPYDMPIHKIVDFSDRENMYLNAAHYTDSCLGAYFEKAKQQSWYENTLFVLISDHSHNTPLNAETLDAGRFRIPLLFYGEVVKPEFRGKVIGKIASQIDVAPTLLGQLGVDYSAYSRSKNILDPSVGQFAFFTWYNGFSWITPNGSFAYIHDQDSYHEVNAADPAHQRELVKEGKAYMQVIYQDFLDY